MNISMRLILLSMFLLASIVFSSNLMFSESEGEENGEKLTLIETYDAARGGVRLVLSYNASSDSFIGSMENVTNENIKSARVEVHLSNGIELGPTKSVNLSAGEKTNVKLSVKDNSFVWWKTHAEVGRDEHKRKHEGENGREHENENREEHGSERNGEHG
jgi:predicted DNA-binding antitoxin AbrB/MazE fold protein